jgi:hypothetical protein
MGKKEIEERRRNKNKVPKIKRQQEIFIHEVYRGR